MQKGLKELQVMKVGLVLGFCLLGVGLKNGVCETRGMNGGPLIGEELLARILVSRA